ncbi:porin family protein [Brevundimonas sp. M20]|uniref:porin family protein n=1 Tax=Brevundimonas sp. M20 TaxID=2591463 RepID=UPI0011467C25|nr:porin family protein [Brevundimonas sp. M20]QDH74027.1 porin family protein [Brevundimonas sp. M20]
MFKTAIAASALVLTALPVAAHAQDESRFYGSVGYSAVSTDQADLGAVTGRFGYKILPWVGAEAEASFGVKDEGYDVSIGGGSGAIELKHDAAAYAVAFLPLGENFELFARAGYGTSAIEATSSGVTVQSDGESFNYGVGATAFFRNDGLRVDWTRRDFTDEGAGEADVWSVSYVRRF